VAQLKLLQPVDARVESEQVGHARLELLHARARLGPAREDVGGEGGVDQVAKDAAALAALFLDGGRPRCDGGLRGDALEAHRQAAAELVEVGRGRHETWLGLGFGFGLG